MWNGTPGAVKTEGVLPTGCECCGWDCRATEFRKFKAISSGSETQKGEREAYDCT